MPKHGAGKPAQVPTGFFTGLGGGWGGGPAGGYPGAWGDPSAGFLGNYTWEAPPPPAPKPRKPAPAKRQYASVEGRWTELEHSKFLEGLHAYGRQVSTCA
jgi:hypothetical protein